MISRIRLVKLFENLQIRSTISILTKFWKSPTNPIFDHRPCYKTVIIFSENFNDQRIWIQREMCFASTSENNGTSIGKQCINVNYITEPRRTSNFVNSDARTRFSRYSLEKKSYFPTTDFYLVR